MNHQRLSMEDPLPPDRRRPGGGWARGGVALALVCIGVGGFFLLSREAVRPRPPAGKPQPVRTRVIQLTAQSFPVVVRSQGVVRAREEVTLSAQVASRVARVSPEFEDGAFFQAGEVVVELDADDFGTAVTMAEARVQSTGAAARLAELNQLRDAELLRNNLLAAAQAEGTAVILAQVRAEAVTAAAQLERARRDLERTRIRAPFAGCVRRRIVGPGQWVTPGAALASVFAVDAVEVRLPVSGTAVAFLKIPGERIHRRESPEERMEVVLEDSMAPNPTVRWRGRVVRGEQALDGETLERFVIVRVDDPFGLESGLPPLRPGQPVTGHLSGQVLTNVLVIPRFAVHELDRIHLVDADTLTLSSKRITPLWADEEHLVVGAEVIPVGQLLATTHLVYAPEGAKVELIPDIAATTTATNGVAGATNPPTANPRTP